MLGEVYTGNENDTTCIIVAKGDPNLGNNTYSGDIVVPEKIIEYGKEYTVVGISTNCFKQSQVTSVILPNTITKWENYGEPANSTFAYTNLTYIKLPEYVTTLPQYFFDYCETLPTVDLPKGLTSIGGQAFRASGIERLLIPQGVTSIGNEAFGWCKKLTKLYMESATPIPTENVAEDAFIYTDIDENTTLYVPIGAKEAYMKVAPWSTFKEIVETDMSTVGISDAKADTETEAARYNMAGQRAGKDSKGLMIIRKANGSTQKRIVK